MHSNQTSETDAELTRLASVNLNLLVPLLALLEERSVTRAAGKVGLSQPAMSHALRRMRQLLGDELIIRQGSKMTLTPRAMELIAPLRRALNDTARIVSPSSFDPAVDRRVISVAMTTSTAFVIGGHIARLLAEHAPNTQLRLITTNLTSNALFTEQGVDVVLLAEAFAFPHPRERLYEDRWTVVSPSSAAEGANTLERLKILPHVVYEVASLRVNPYEVLEAHGLQHTVRARVSDNLLIPHVLAASGGVAILGWGVAAAFSRSLDLRIEEFPFPVPALGIDTIWNPWLADDQFTTWMRGILTEAAESFNAAQSP
jgi:DNA-binding transcriptional LysR family regulator